MDKCHPEEAPRIFAALPAILEKGQHTQEYRFLHKNGEYRWMYDKLTLIRNKRGEPVKIIGAWTDITERRRAEGEIHRLNAGLEQRVKDRTAELEAINKELAQGER